MVPLEIRFGDRVDIRVLRERREHDDLVWGSGSKVQDSGLRVKGIESSGLGF